MGVNLGWLARQENDLAEAVSRFETGLWQSRRTGEPAGLAYASLGLACAAADLGDWQRAAELHGVAQAFPDRLTEPWQDLEEAYRRGSMAKVRAALGGDEFDRATPAAPDSASTTPSPLPRPGPHGVTAGATGPWPWRRCGQIR